MLVRENVRVKERRPQRESDREIKQNARALNRYKTGRHLKIHFFCLN